MDKSKEIESTHLPLSDGEVVLFKNNIYGICYNAKHSAYVLRLQNVGISEASNIMATERMIFAKIDSGEMVRFSFRNWPEEIRRLEQFFSSAIFPRHAIQLDVVSRLAWKPSYKNIKLVKREKKSKEPYLIKLQKLKENIINRDPVPRFIKTHMRYVKANQDNKVYEPYLNRLQTLKGILEKDDLTAPEERKKSSMSNNIFLV